MHLVVDPIVHVTEDVLRLLGVVSACVVDIETLGYQFLNLLNSAVKVGGAVEHSSNGEEDVLVSGRAREQFACASTLPD